ncbi:hypothetical protein [Paenibacillus amylolyticus]|uniref:Uncharacterized protein n=1 Tax=Paenibacillus amylolyticus TaxID=1451 RepID=A0ABD8B3L4_PAEAM
MNNLQLKRIGVVMILIFAFITSFVPYNAAASEVQSTSSNTSTSQPPSGEEVQSESGSGSDKWYIPDWVIDLIEKIDNMIQNFKDLMSGKLIKEAIVGFIVLMTDDALTPLYDAFSKGFLFTPQVAEIDGVWSTWSIFMILAMVAILLAVLFLSIQVYRGKAALKTILKTFIGAFVINFISLTILNIINVLINMGTQNMLQGALGTSGIIYQGLDGQQILKALIVGVEGITDPTYAGQTLGQVVVETPGGVFVLICYSLFIVLPFYLVVVGKQLVLILMAVLVPGWISYAAFSGKYETLIGFLNLYIRTLFTGFLCAIYWAIFVQQQSKWSKGEGFFAALGIPPVLLALFMGLMLLFAIYFIWIKPLFSAIKNPISLNGANVVEGLSKFGVKTSESLSNMGKRFGSEGLQKRASDLEHASRNLGDTAERIKNQRSVTADSIASRLTGGISDSMRNLEYKEPETWVKESNNIISVEENDIELGTAKTFVSTENMEKKLVEKGFAAGAVIDIKGDDKKTVEAQLASLESEQREGIRWSTHTGKLFIPDVADNVYESLQKAGVDVSVIQESFEKDGLAVQMETGKPMMLEETKGAEKALKAVEKALPYHVETNLSPADANQMYKEMSSRSDEFDWVDDLQMENDKLWIPKEHAEDIQHVMEEMISNLTNKTRMDFPKNAQFAEKMITEWKDHAGKEWAKEIELGKDGSHVYVPEKHKKEFVKSFDEYRKDKTPFWRARNGKTYVVKDGVPVMNGQPPLNGLDMGSYEAFQNEMRHKHASQKRKTRPETRSKPETKKKPENKGVGGGEKK